jgi:hypothetical protein
MPKYTFECPRCNNVVKKYTTTESIVKCVCGEDMSRQLPTINTPTTTELIDSYMGVALPSDNDEILKSRKDEYFWAVEVPRLVNKYSVEHCLQNGWLYLDDKDQLQIQTKPPHKR